MKTRLRSSLLATVAVGALAFSAQSASAQCDYYDSDSFGFSFEIRRGHDHYVPDRYYYDEDCDYNRGRYIDDYDYERYDRRPVQQTRRIIRVYPDGRAVPNGVAINRQPVRDNSVPVVTTRRQPPEPRTATSSKQPVQTFDDNRDTPVSPYLNDISKKAEPAPKKPAATFELELPDPAPRQNRNAERLPAPEVPAPPSTSTSAKVGNTKAVVDGEFPLDLVIANSDDEFVTVREMIGDNQAILIDFWASWCGPCIQSMPELKRRAEGYKNIKVAVAGMNVESDVTIASRIRKQHGMETVTWLVEPKSQPFSNKFKIDSIPQVMLVDRNGSVLFKGFPNDRKLETALDKLAQN